MNILTLLMYISISSVVPAFILSLIKWEKHRSRLAGLLCLFLLVSGAVDSLSFLIVEAGSSNVKIVNFYTAVEFTLLSLVYAHLISNLRAIVYYIIAFYILFFISNSLYLEGINNFQSYTTALEGIIVIVYAFAYFIQLTKNAPSIDLMYFAPFWINTAILVYFSFNLVLFAFGNYAFTHLSPRMGMVLWMFHNINNIFKNILLAVGVYHFSHLYMRSAPRWRRLL